MTRRQAQVLTFINNFKAVNGFSPTYQEIAKELNLTSLATVHKHVYCLVAQGKVRVSARRKSGIEVVENNLPPDRFVLKEPNHLWDNESQCWWVREALPTSAINLDREATSARY
jgi:SOS-response transcriptional repressor LexA